MCTSLLQVTVVCLLFVGVGCDKNALEVCTDSTVEQCVGLLNREPIRRLSPRRGRRLV